MHNLTEMISSGLTPLNVVALLWLQRCTGSNAGNYLFLRRGSAAGGPQPAKVHLLALHFRCRLFITRASF